MDGATFDRTGPYGAAWLAVLRLAILGENLMPERPNVKKYK